ncbi:MAG: ThiF family adenylyltransferase [Alphaproteobacteria bacterium]|nr:ThiF family adenylyltransferase [Alphaproteobacteria bacterium]
MIKIPHPSDRDGEAAYGAAPLDDAALDRFSRQVILAEIGEEGQTKLAAGQVMIVGCGALGSTVAMLLAGAGVGGMPNASHELFAPSPAPPPSHPSAPVPAGNGGMIMLVDGDHVEASNLTRQIAFDSEQIGFSKARGLAEKMSLLWPQVSVYPVAEMLIEQRLPSLLSIFEPSSLGSAAADVAGDTARDQGDLSGSDLVPRPIIVDATDSMVARRIVGQCRRTNHRVVWGAVAGFEGRVGVAAHPYDPCFFCAFPDPTTPGQVARCDSVGVLGAAASLAASWMSWHVIRLLLAPAGARNPSNPGGGTQPSHPTPAGARNRPPSSAAAARIAPHPVQISNLLTGTVDDFIVHRSPSCTVCGKPR